LSTYQSFSVRSSANPCRCWCQRMTPRQESVRLHSSCGSEPFKNSCIVRFADHSDRPSQHVWATLFKPPQSSQHVPFLHGHTGRIHNSILASCTRYPHPRLGSTFAYRRPQQVSGPRSAFGNSTPSLSLRTMGTKGRVPGYASVSLVGAIDFRTTLNVYKALAVIQKEKRLNFTRGRTLHVTSAFPTRTA
jgi:hypothetical protein